MNDLKELSVLLPVLTLIIGWLFGQLSERRKNIDERRRKVSKAICELLELHHALRSYQRTIKCCHERFQKHGASEFQIRKIILSSSLPFDPKLAQRYDDAVTQLAEVEPILAFRLRNKHQVNEWFKWTNLIPVESPNDQAFFIKIEKEMLDMFLPNLRDLISTSGRYLSFSVRRSLRKTMEDQSPEPADLSRIFDQIDLAISKARNAETLPPNPNPAGPI